MNWSRCQCNSAPISYASTVRHVDHSSLKAISAFPGKTRYKAFAKHKQTIQRVSADSDFRYTTDTSNRYRTSRLLPQANIDLSLAFVLLTISLLIRSSFRSGPISRSWDDSCHFPFSSPKTFGRVQVMGGFSFELWRCSSAICQGGS